MAHRWPGPLAGWLDGLADWSVTPPLNRLRAWMQTISRLRRAAGVLEAASIRWVFRRVRPDLVWCNTVVTVALGCRRRGAAGPGGADEP